MNSLFTKWRPWNVPANSCRYVNSGWNASFGICRPSSSCSSRCAESSAPSPAETAGTALSAEPGAAGSAGAAARSLCPALLMSHIPGQESLSGFRCCSTSSHVSWNSTHLQREEVPPPRSAPDG